MKVRESALAAVAMMLVGCAPSASKGGFDSPNPAAKAYAIEQAVRKHDESSIPDLVEQLDHDDPLIRFLAIAALERLTRETLGYVHYAEARERREAIERWRRFVLDGAGARADKGTGVQPDGD